MPGLVPHSQGILTRVGISIGRNSIYKKGVTPTPPIIPVFDMSLTSSLTNGVGELSEFTRNDSDATVTDFEGLVKDVTADEARFVGARRVENLIASANPLDWSVQAQVQSIVPNGTYLGSPVWRVTTNTGLISVDLTDVLAGKIAVGDTIRNSLYYKFVSGNFAGGNGLGLRTGNTTVTNIGTTGSTNTDWTRLAAAATSANTTTLNYGLTFLQASQIVFDICMVQSEDVSGQSNQNPSEYVSVGVGTEADALGGEGEFTNDSGYWALSRAVISGGECHMDAPLLAVCQATQLSVPLVKAGRLYEVTFEVTDFTSGTGVHFVCGGVTGIDRTAVGVYTEVIRTTLDGTVGLITTSGIPVTDITVDNFVVKEIDHGSNADGVKYFPYTNPNSVSSNIVTNLGVDQTLLTNGDFSTSDTSSLGNNAGWAWSSQPDSWEISGGQARHVGAGIGVLSARTAAGGALNAELGRVYKLTYTIAGASLGTVNLGGNTFDIDGNPLPVTVGTYTRYVEATSITTLLGFVSQAAPSAATIDNVSVSIAWVIPEDTLRGVLIEEASVNVIADSEAFDAAGTVWVEQGVVVPAYSVSVRSPNGLLKATELTAANLGGTSTAVQVYTPVNVTGNDDNTFSIYAKARTLNWISLESSAFNTSGNGNTFFDLANGVVGTTSANHTAQIEDAGNGWYRCSISADTQTDSNGIYRVRLASADNNNTVNLNGTDGIYIFGAQCDTGLPHRTSYIPTSGGTAQRNAELLQYTAPAYFIGNADANDFTYSCKFNIGFDTDLLASGKRYLMVISNPTPTRSAQIQVLGTGALQVAKQLVGEQAVTYPTSPLSAGTYKIAGRFSSIDDLAIVVDGGAVTTGGNSLGINLTVTPTLFTIGADVNSLNYANGTYKNAKIYDKALSDTQMQDLTA